MSLPPSKPRRLRNAATLADVGREAGVSAMAASAVLNGARTSARIADETRARILAAADKLNYRPNAAARALTQRRMNTLGLLTQLSRRELNQYFLEVFNGVIEAADEAGQSTTVFTCTDWQQGLARVPELCDGRIDGLVLLAPMPTGPAASLSLPDHTPLVSIHANIALPGVPNLECDEEAGAHAMVAHMLAMGHRRILHLGGPSDSLGARRRAAGYLSAHAQAGLRPPHDHVRHGAFSTEAGASQLRAWLNQHRGEPLPHAIFAGSDAIALGCLQTLEELGWRTPGDVSVVGFDDTQLARSAHLATVRQPLHELGRRAVQLLLEGIGAKLDPKLARPSSSAIVLPTELVLGATLSAPRRESLLIP